MSDPVKEDRATKRKYWLYRLSRNLFWLCFKLWNRLEIHGLENCPRTGGLIIAANHTSFLDPPLVGSSIRYRNISFLARDSLFVNKYFGAFMRKVQSIPLSRTKGDLTAIRTALSVLAGGGAVALFPEGTRSSSGEMQEAKGGVGLIISRAKVPVLPVFVEGSYQSMSRHSSFIRPTKIRVYVGKPIQPEELDISVDGKKDYRAVGQMVLQRIADTPPKHSA